MTATTEPKLICTECRHENDAARIFCHNCGERLDRSKMASVKKAPEGADARRRLQKMMEGPSKLRQNFFAIGKVLLAAAVAAGLVEIALPPDVPTPTKTAAQQIDLELENLASHQRSGPLEYSQDQINAYLAYRLAGKKKVLNEPFLTFVRATASFREDDCTIGIERSLFGYSLFSRISYRTSSADGKISPITAGGWVGRLPIHPAIMKYCDKMFADLWSALDRERRLISKMGAVTFHEGSVTISAPVR
jgi:hypothetical protein